MIRNYWEFEEATLTIHGGCNRVLPYRPRYVSLRTCFTGRWIDEAASTKNVDVRQLKIKVQNWNSLVDFLFWVERWFLVETIRTIWNLLMRCIIRRSPVSSITNIFTVGGDSFWWPLFHHKKNEPQWLDSWAGGITQGLLVRLAHQFVKWLKIAAQGRCTHMA